jgi:uncharacterized protein YciI
MDRSYQLLFLNGIPGKAPTAEVVGQHAAHLAELDRRGKLVLAGPLLGRFGGLIVLRADSLAEVRGIAEEDPMVRVGFQSYDVVTWLLANQQNKYQPDL